MTELEAFEAWWESWAAPHRATRSVEEMARAKQAARAAWLIGIKSPPPEEDDERDDVEN